MLEIDAILERKNSIPKINNPMAIPAPKIKVNKLIFDAPSGIKNPITADANTILDKSMKYEESVLICVSFNFILSIYQK